MKVIQAPVLALLFAPAPGTSGGAGLGIFLFQMLAFIAIIYFLILRPKIQQEKRHRERLAALKKGDRVVTVGGLIGEIVHLKDDQVTLKTGEARVLVQRDRIADVTGEPPAAQEATKS